MKGNVKIVKRMSGKKINRPPLCSERTTISIYIPGGTRGETALQAPSDELPFLLQQHRAFVGNWLTECRKYAILRQSNQSLKACREEA
jgi:hypothetical protein